MTQAPNPLTGVFWMIVTGFCFVAMTALVKLIGPHIPAAQAAFIRYVLGLVFLIPVIRPLMATRFSRDLAGLFALRGVFHTCGVVLWFFAMARIPIAEVTAMNYLSPIYITIGAALFFGERLALRRILAITAALIGALIILRPGFRELSSGHLAMLATALFLGGSYLTAKPLADRVSPAVIVGMLSITVTIGLVPLALTNWVSLTLPELGLLFLVACCATAGHYTMMLAFRAAPLTVTQPVTFLQLVWAAMVGWFIFGESIDALVILGGTIIMASVVYISWREAAQRKTPQATPIKDDIA